MTKDAKRSLILGTIFVGLVIVWLVLRKTVGIQTKSEHSSAGAPSSDSVRIENAYRERYRRIVETLAISRPPLPGSIPSKQGEGAPQRDELDAEYMENAVVEILPLLKECYDQARQKQPDLGATNVTLLLSVVADPVNGGIVERSELDSSNSFDTNPAFKECVTQTAYSLRLPTPTVGGRAEIAYPLTFGLGPSRDTP